MENRSGARLLATLTISERRPRQKARDCAVSPETLGKRISSSARLSIGSEPRGAAGRSRRRSGPGFAVLAARVDPRTVLTRDAYEGWAQLEARSFAVRAIDDELLDDTDIIDLDGVLITWLARFGQRAVV